MSDTQSPEPQAAPPASDEASSTPAAPATAGAHPKPRPPGEPEGIVRIREMVETQLAKLVDSYAVQEGSYVLGFRSARVFVVPAWLESGATVIRIFAITNLDVPVTGELSSYLMAKNLDFVCGAFALDPAHGAVWFNHNLLGDFAMPEEIQATIVMVAETADQFDDEIKSRFGGRLYVETPDQVVPPPVSPGYL